jgi:hypothetical protein
MPGYAPIHPVAGIQPFNTLFIPDTTQRWGYGMVMDAVDPYFGFGRFIYAKAVAAQVPGTVCVMSGWPTTPVMTAAPSTANLGLPVYIAAQNFAINTFGWYCFEGVLPVTQSATTTAGAAVGLGTAGNLTGTLVAGKQVLGINVQQIATFTITKSAGTTNGSPVIAVNGVDGLFVGLTLSGTGIAAGTIASIDPSGRFITSTANSTATGQVTMTGTYTGYCLASIQNPFTQGAIT